MEHEKKKAQMFYSLLCLAAVLILVFPVGIANVIFGYVFKDSPCILCWGQREGMIFIGVMALFIVRYGLKPKYLAMLLLMSGFGLYQSFAHLGNHAHRDLHQGFGPPIFGFHTYSWAEFVFWVVIIVLGALFFISPKLSALEEQNGEKGRALSKPILMGFVLSALVVASNAFQAFVSTGIPPFLGQGDPVRFSLNPKYIIWSTDSWKTTWTRFSLQGPRGVERPDFAFDPSKINFVHEAKQSPFLAFTKELQVKKIETLPIQQAVNSLSEIEGEFVVSSKYDVFFLNSSFEIQDYFRVDPYYSATIDPIVGIETFGKNQYVLMGANKTFLRFSKNPHANEAIEYANFIAGADRFQAEGKGLGRGRISTVRSKFYYIQSLASDSKYLYFATIPNKKHKELIISSVLLDDFTLSSEFKPEVILKEDRTLGELYITAIHKTDDGLYLLSKNYNVILKVDLNSQKVIEVSSYPAEIINARAMLINGDQFTLLSYQDGKNLLFYIS